MPVVVSYTCNQHNHAMESTIGLRFSALPNQSICMPSGLYAARVTKPHLSFNHSSLSLPKDSKSLSLGYNSSLSLPNSPKGRLIEYIPGPITCMQDGSLPPTYTRVDTGRANMAWASPFLRNIGSGRRTNRKGNAAQKDGLPRAVGISSPATTNIDHHFELMEMAKKLKESKEYEMALKLLKDHEPKVLDDLEAAYQLKMELMHILYLQGKHREALKYAEEFYEKKAIYAKRFQYELFYATKLMEIALNLKETQHYDLAVELLKVHDPEVEKDTDASYYVKMEIMHMLFLQEKYEDAWTYCEELYKKEQIYRPHFKLGLFYALKSGILCGLNRHEEAIECMQKFNDNRREAIPLTPPDKDVFIH